MKATTFLTAILTVDLVVGAKWTQKRREAREARRLSQPRPHSSGPSRYVDGPVVGLKHEGELSNETHTAYSENWAGAALVSTGYTSVTGTIIVPTPTSSNAGQESAGAAWVGIDGDTCTSAILQTGIDWYTSNNVITYDAWYEWYPDYSYSFSPSQLALKAGDTIRLTVTATSTTSGSALIENLTTGQHASQAFANVADGELCEANAEWIVEDFESCGDDGDDDDCELVPFANFGKVDFKNSSATHDSGTKVTPGTAGEGLMVIDLYQNGQVLTDCVVSGSAVNCTYL